MITTDVTAEMIEKWKDDYEKYRPLLKANRKTGKEVLEYLKEKYILEEITDSRAKSVIAKNVLDNEYYRRKLPVDGFPDPAAFIVKNEGNGKTLYDNQDEIFEGMTIFVGIDLSSGVYQAEGSSMLWDELLAFQGLDDDDLDNPYLVSEYASLINIHSEN